MPIYIPAGIAMPHGSMSTYAADQHGSTYSTSRDDKAASVLAVVLPQFVRRRLTPLRSIKDIATSYIRPAAHQRGLSISSQASSSAESIVPPPPYSEDPLSSDEDDMDGIFASAPSSRPSSSGHATPSASNALRTNTAQLSEDLVRYKFANQGLLLVAQSAQELRASPSANNDYQRRLYLDGIAYLLRALPDGLSESERASLQAALPADLREESEPVVEVEESQPTPRGSALAGLVSLVVFWTFIAFAAALPYVRSGMQRLYAIERKHKLGEHVLAHGLALAQITYKQFVSLILAVWMFNDGMIGRLISELSVWCAQHISEGVRDGLKEAASALRRSQEQ